MSTFELILAGFSVFFALLAVVFYASSRSNRDDEIKERMNYYCKDGAIGGGG